MSQPLTVRMDICLPGCLHITGPSNLRLHLGEPLCSACPTWISYTRFGKARQLYRGGRVNLYVCRGRVHKMYAVQQGVSKMWFFALIIYGWAFNFSWVKHWTTGNDLETLLNILFTKNSMLIILTSKIYIKHCLQKYTLNILFIE